MNNIELLRKIEALENKVDNLVKVGLVTAVKGGNVRVEINGVDSHELPVLFPKTQDDSFQAMPDIGEQVLCVFLPFDITQGFCLGCMYSETDVAPVEGSSKAHIKFKDNTMLEYDRDSHKLSIDLSGALGDVEVKCKNLNAEVTENANITAKNVLVDVAEKTELKSAVEVVIDSPKTTIKNGGEGMGIVTTECVCNVLGINHAVGSEIAKAQKA